ncbi:MAG: Tat pathway signal sequence domain protein [Caulobacteraceae bacterium]|nr:Tat pathway signal sequence domain protein [Caulobacteraceae bacterium]
MRVRVLPIIALAAASIFATTVLPFGHADAQTTRQDRAERAEREKRQQEEAKEREKRRAERGPAPLARQRAQGPCPYVKILYDAARYVEFTGGRQSASAVSYSGEIQGVESRCAYESDEPIRVDMVVSFALGKGPTAPSPNKNYRWWIAVTERNKSVFYKQYFDMPTEFGATDRATTEQVIEGLTIPRANAQVSGSNFEILIGFDVTPQMAEFNREGRRFRIQAGQTPAAPGGQ